MKLGKLGLAQQQDSPQLLHCVLATMSAGTWLSASIAISPRFYFVGDYSVLQLDAEGWGFDTVTPVALVVSVFVAVAMFMALLRVHSHQATSLLLATSILPSLQFLRTMGWEVPVTFIEPLGFVVCTGLAVQAIAANADTHSLSKEYASGYLVSSLLVVVSVGFALWWYHQACVAHDSYLFGFRDVGSFTRRIANTWAGRGFLQESPSVATHWDHFHPGLAFVVPLWGLWPNIKLIFLLHGIALALPAFCVFGMARRFDASRTVAFAWAMAYLAFPAVGQFNMSYTYGWHPISFALPFLFAMVWAVLEKRLWMALLSAVAACLFKETAIVAIACLAGSAGISSWLAKRDPRFATFAVLKPWQWFVASFGFALVFLVICKYSPFTNFQSGRFGELGTSTTEVALSPFTNPVMFFGAVFKTRSWFYVAALMIPLQFRQLLRAWPIMLAIVPSLAVVLAMDGAPATCFGCHYATTLVPTLFLAAMIGSQASMRSDDNLPCNRGTTMFAAGLATCVSCIVASTYYGSVAWSNVSMRPAEFGTYHGIGDQNAAADRRPGSTGHGLLNAVIAEIGGPHSRILCTGKLYTHLLSVERLECLAEIDSRWPALQHEAGIGNSPLELFDWVLLDTREFFHQSSDGIVNILDEAKRAGFELVLNDRGIVLLRHPARQSVDTIALR